MGLIKKIVGKNYQSQCGTEGDEKLMKKVKALFVWIKAKVETVTKEMTERTAIRFRKFMDPANFFKLQIQRLAKFRLLKYGSSDSICLLQ